jgi:hypothetical protein
MMRQTGPAFHDGVGEVGRALVVAARALAEQEMLVQFT